MATITFHKMHGLGNDFVIFHNQENVPLTPPFLQHVACRKTGVGCDQVIVVNDASYHVNYDVDMRIFNADGGEVGACGNATRCVAKLINKDNLKINTYDDLLICHVNNDNAVSVQLRPPFLRANGIPYNGADASKVDLPVVRDMVGDVTGFCVNVGNPHVVFVVGDVDAIDLEKIGPLIEDDPLFPERVNVEFIQILDDDHIKMRVWERGSGITQACGTGACAVQVAAFEQGLVGRHSRVEMPGGDLMISYGGRDYEGGVIHMRGEAAYVYEGKIEV